MLLVSTLPITKFTELKFTAPEETTSASLPIVAPGNAWTVKPSIPLTYLGMDADNIVTLLTGNNP